MKALSIRQPWAWAILYAGKDIENREWQTRYRGPLLIHASARKPTRADLEAFLLFTGMTRERLAAARIVGKMPTGGVVGRVDLVDIVTKSDSPWFCGPYGWVLANPRPLQFTEWKGQLGLFEVPGPFVEAP